MTVYRMFDASADIPTTVPPGFDAVAGYVGGNTPHEWKLSEWQRFSKLRQFPIWVDNHELTSPETSATNAAKATKALGWRANHTRAIILDVETIDNPKWVAAFGKQLLTTGYFLVVYGSVSTVAKTRASRLWIANASQNPALSPGQSALGYQVYFDEKLPTGGTVDISLISEEFLKLGGVGPRS